MKRRNILRLSIIAVLLVSIVGGASAYHEYVQRFDDTHTSCHGVNDGESAIGTLDVTFTPNGTHLEPYQAFTISIVILNFTELDNSAYQNRTTIGISKEYGDNAAFFRGVSNQSFSRRVKVDQYGSDLTPTTLGAVAPATPGTYNLIIVAVAGMNQSTEADYNFVFAKGTVSVTVVAPSGPGTTPPPSTPPPTIAGGLLTVIIGVTFTVSTVLILSMRKRLRKRDL